MSDSNIVFTVSLHDLMSKKLKEIESEVDRLDNKLKNLGNGNSDLFGKNFGSGLKTHSIAAGVAFGEAAYHLIAKGARMIKDFGEDVIKKGQERSFMKTDINTMAGSFGPKLFDQLQDYMTHSLLGPKVFEHAKEMLAFGFDPQKIMPALKAIGNISGGNEEKMGRLEYAMSELNAGDVSYRHIRQLMQAGLPAKDLAKEFKMSAMQFKDAIKHQTISGEQIANAITRIGNDTSGRFGGRMAAQMETPAGKLTQLETNWEAFKGKLGEAILGSKGFAKFMEDMNKLFDKNPEFMDKLTEVGSRLFELFDRMVNKFTIFIEDGGLDRIINSISFIADHFEQIVGVLVSSKILSSLMSIGGGLGLSGIQTMGGALLVAIAGFSVHELAVSYAEAMKNDKNPGFESGLHPLLSNFAGQLEEANKRYVNSDFSTSVGAKNLSDAIYEVLGKRLPVDKLTALFNDAKMTGAKNPWEDFYDHYKGQGRPGLVAGNEVGNKIGKFFGMPDENTQPLDQFTDYVRKLVSPFVNLVKKVDKNTKDQNAKDKETGPVTTVHGPRNTNVYITINDGFGNFTINNTSSKGNLLEDVNQDTISKDIIQLLEEAVNDGINRIKDR